MAHLLKAGHANLKNGFARRGAKNDDVLFAIKFVEGRLRGFEKDIRICLTGTKQNDGYISHAYFPALVTCCGMLEYLAGLHCGRLDGLGKREFIAYSTKFLRQPDYDTEAIRILFDAFRNPVAHRGIASGVWVDRHRSTLGRRLTWIIHASTNSPAIQLRATPGELRRDSPWPCQYSHRVHIYLGRLWRDIRTSADKYLIDVTSTDTLQVNFMNCMKYLYPV